MAVLVRRVKRFLQKDANGYSPDFMPILKVLNGLLIQIGRLEQWIVTKLNLNLPFGLSVVSVQQRNTARDRDAT